MTEGHFADLGNYARTLAGLTPDRERLLQEAAPQILPHLDGVTTAFYEQLQNVPRAAPFLEGRLPQLRRTHRIWLEAMFTSAYDAAFVERIYRIGDAHLRAGLPVEFMGGGVTIIGDHLLPVICELAGEDRLRASDLARAVNAALGFTLIVMQESYQLSKLALELDKFLAITGISRDLFTQLSRGEPGRPVADLPEAVERLRTGPLR